MSAPGQIPEIVALIRRLSPDQRRALFRHLRLSGLLDTESLKTDRERLRVAPALGKRQPRTSAHDKPAHSPAPTSSRADAEYRSPVSGHMVVGTPADGDTELADPHAMHPLPGRAPEQPISVVFDGGSRGNPGQGYGSFALNWPGLPQQVVRLQFGDRVTNNEAEYDTLIAALETVLKRLREHDADPATAQVEIQGDSQLVINQVRGQWKCNEERLRIRRDRVRDLLERFGAWELTHHDRQHSVDVLGH
jgi:ribonuclease HI